MSSKKGAKKNRARCPKPEDHSAEQVVFGLLSELLSRGVEQGAYRWCLQKNADPARTVFISCVPAEMPDGVICSVMARTLNRGQVRLVDTVKAEDSIYQSLLVEAEGKMDSSICPTLIRCEDCPLGYWIMVAPVEDHNMEPPPAKALPPAKEPPPAKTLLPAKEPPPEKALPPAKTLPPAKEPPPEKILPPAKQPPPAKTLLPAKELPPEKALPPAKTLPPAKEPPPEKTLPPAKQPPPAKTLLPAKEPPPAKALSPAKEPPPSASLSPAKEPPLAKALLPAKGQPPAKQPPPANEQPPSAALSPVKEPPPAKALPPVKEPPPAKALPPVKEPPPAKALPPVKEPPPAKALPPVKEPPPAKALPPVKEPPPAKALPPVKEPPPAQALSPAKDPPAAQVPPPATEPPMIDKKAKEENLQIVINGSVGLGIQLQNSGNFDTVFREQSPILNFGNGDKPEPPIMNRSETVTKARYNAVWGGFSMERQKRREDIEKGLHFIQSTIPFNGSEDANKHFLQELVENLFTEGNDLYREGEVKLALGQYTEGLTVAEYAASEELTLSQELVCRLFVNRSCCYYSMGLFEKSLEDSDRALNLDKENMRALYRKARALNKLGNHQEAYTCISHRILVLVQDESVTELAQELVQKLGLKQRRAYKRPQQELETYGLMSNGLSTSAGCKASNGMGSVDDIYTDFAMDSKLFPSTLGISCQSDGLVTAACPPSMASTTNPVNDFIDCDVIGDELDSFLDFEMASKQVPQLIPVFPTGNQLLSTLGTAVLPAASPLPPASFGLLNPLKQAVVPLQPTFSIHLDTLDSFGTARETLDSLDTFVNDSKHLEPLSLKGNQKQKPGGITVNHLFTQKTDHIQSLIPTLPQALPANPLAHTHDFKQGCLLCYVKTGPRAVDYTHKEKLEHKCKKDILLGRMKSSENKAWLKIRLRPMKVNFNGPFMLCKDIQSRQDCKYGDNCTFAYYQEEIDVWNEERKGAFHRDQLFQPPGLVKPGSVSRLLHEQMGIFTFLCQACFNSKPKIISKRNPENPDFCTNPSNQHSFPDHKCLVHVLNSSTVKYSKIRPIHIRFQMDMCRHEIRYGCLQEDTCNFAHSHVELCVWMLQKQSGVSQEEIVLESERMWKVAEPKVKPPTKSLDMKMKFVCGQCLQNGREIEADRDGKYCTAKARHSWTKDKRVLLVMSKAKTKWVPIRPLPSVRSFPQQYEICVHVQNGKKCQYIGICTFAHNSEEKDIWTFMKENKVLDLQLIFDLCKKNSSAEKPGKTAATLGPQKETEKPIVMPTDYADLMAGFHCYLCGKNSNSERQWQKHIQSEKHKDRVFTLESEESIWKYRFPAGEFKLCERFEETQNCPNENNCPFAHGREELAEWHERRQVLQYKVSKARKDMLLEPSDSDFGKYSFLMQDLAEVSEESGIAGTLWSKVLSP